MKLTLLLPRHLQTKDEFAICKQNLTVLNVTILSNLEAGSIVENIVEILYHQRKYWYHKYIINI